MEADEKECPFCAEIIKAKAKVCKHCKSDLSKADTTLDDGSDIPERLATEKQKDYLRDLGATFPDDLTISQASEAIDEIKEGGYTKSRVDIIEDDIIDVVNLSEDNPKKEEKKDGIKQKVKSPLDKKEPSKSVGCISMIVVIVVLYLVIKGIFGSGDAKNDPDTASSVATSQREVVAQENQSVEAVPAEQIMADYKKNEIGGDNKYKGKNILVIGRVKKIIPGMLSGAYLNLSTNDGELSFDFEEKSKSPLGEVNEGDIVTVSGVARGMTLGSVSFKDAKFGAIVKAADQELIQQQRVADAAIKQKEKEEKVAKLKILIDSGIESGVIKKINESSSTIWVDPVTWRNSSRDDKEFIIKMAGSYFSALEDKEYLYGYVKSFANDKLLGETKMFGGVEIYE